MATRDLKLVAEVDTELCRVKRGRALGGYRSEILTENLSQREVDIYKCKRCKGIMKNGVIFQPDEQICAYCLKKGEKSLCNTPVHNAILSLKCSCPLSKRGCDWLGQLENVEKHLKTCGHVYVSCELNCGTVTTRGEMGSHVKEMCRQRKNACLHCMEVYKVCEMEEHVKVCGKVEIKCELGCGIRVCRDGMSCHRENECLEERVVCPYEKYRCEVAGLKRRELKQHLEESRMVHVELKVNTMDEEITTLKNQVEVLELKLKSKDDVIEYFKEEVKVRFERTIKCSIENIISYFKPNQKYSAIASGEFTVAGYKFILCHNTDALNFNIYFGLLSGDNYESLEWPLKVIFITKMICHKDTKQSLITKSPVMELQKDQCSVYQRIFSFPLSAGLKDFIRSESLDLEVILRIP